MKKNNYNLGKDWEEEFDEKFGYIEVGGGLGKENLTSKDIKLFICNLLQSARKEERERLRGIVEKLPQGEGIPGVLDLLSKIEEKEI